MLTNLYGRGKLFFPSVFVTLVCILLVSATGCGGAKNANFGVQVTKAGTKFTQATEVAPTFTPVAKVVPTFTPVAKVGPKFIYVDTWNNIHPLMMFNNHITNPAAVARRYDFVSSASWYNVSQYHVANPNIFLTHYIPFHRDDGTYSNYLARRSLAQWKAFHPDWVLYKCDRVTPVSEFGSPAITFDFSNPAVENYQVQAYAVPASRAGYNGITVDNLNLENLFGACGTYQHGKWVQRYSGQYNDARWEADTVRWIAMMQQSLHSLPHPLSLILNLGYGPSLTPVSPIIQQILAYSDGILDEAGFTHYGTYYLTDQYWVQAIQLSNIVQNQGKPFLIVNNFPKVDRAAVQWALSSYLMAKGHYCYVFISTTQNYGIDAWYNEYNAKIGAPTSAMYSSQNVYWRNFTNGLSIVNPSSRSAFNVTLSSSHRYVDLYGKAVGPTIVLSPHSGIVLLTTA